MLHDFRTIRVGALRVWLDEEAFAEYEADRTEFDAIFERAAEFHADRLHADQFPVLLHGLHGCWQHGHDKKLRLEDVNLGDGDDGFAYFGNLEYPDGSVQDESLFVINLPAVLLRRGPDSLRDLLNEPLRQRASLRLPSPSISGGGSADADAGTGAGAGAGAGVGAGAGAGGSSGGSNNGSKGHLAAPIFSTATIAAAIAAAQVASPAAREEAQREEDAGATRADNWAERSSLKRVGIGEVMDKVAEPPPPSAMPAGAVCLRFRFPFDGRSEMSPTGSHLVGACAAIPLPRPDLPQCLARRISLLGEPFKRGGLLHSHPRPSCGSGCRCREPPCRRSGAGEDH
jgi:hypothetical protein